MNTEKTIDQISTHDLMESGRPALHSANIRPSAQDTMLSQTIEVTSECMSALYGGLLLLGKPFADRLNEEHPETAVVYQNAIMNEFIPAFARKFPDFANFSVKVLPNGVLQGQNEFTSTVLQFLINLANAPIDSGNYVNPGLIYTPSLPNEVWREDDLDNYYDHDDDDLDPHY